MKINEANTITIKGHVRLEFKNVHTGEIRIEEVDNLVTTVGKVAIIENLRGLASRGVITYCAVGTDATAPDVGDTVLGTELARKLVSVRSNSSNVATFQTFFTTSEANGTLAEAGLFGDLATAVADSGTLFCHTAISKTKTSGETLTITWTVTIG